MLIFKQNQEIRVPDQMNVDWYVTSLMIRNGWNDSLGSDVRKWE